MADISLVRGDTRNIQLSVTDSASAVVNITDAVLKFAAKCDLDEPNDEAFVFKRSYDQDEIEITDAVNGVALIKILPADTAEDEPGDWKFDVELTRRGTEIVNTTGGGATASVTLGSTTITCTAVDLSSVKRGDIIALVSGNPENAQSITVESVDDAANTLETDFDGWVTEAGLEFIIYRGIRDTVVSGTFTITPDVVR